MVKNNKKKESELKETVASCDRKNISIENLIHNIRGQKVMLDSDLAMLYGVETRALNQAVKRNIRRFPDDFMFQVTKEEWNALRSQIVTLEDLKSQNVISNLSENQQEGILISQFVTSKPIERPREIIEKIIDVVAHWSDYATPLGISQETIGAIKSTIITRL